MIHGATMGHCLKSRDGVDLVDRGFDLDGFLDVELGHVEECS